MRIATWNLRYNAGAEVWPRLWSALNLDILCLQEAARPDTEDGQLWELVPGNKWGSAVVLSSGTIDPIEIPNYRGWVVGGEVHESSLQTDGRRMFVFSLHSPTSSATVKRASYIQEVNSVVSILERVIPTESDLILGGDFNFTIGERQAGEFQSTLPAEREVKSAAYLQSWKQEKVSAISFDIAQKRPWDAETNAMETDVVRVADVYIFCLLQHKDKSSVDPLNLSQWTFFAVPTPQIHATFGTQKSVSLGPLSILHGPSFGFTELKTRVVEAAKWKSTRLITSSHEVDDATPRHSNE